MEMWLSFCPTVHDWQSKSIGNPRFWVAVTPITPGPIDLKFHTGDYVSDLKPHAKNCKKKIGHSGPVRQRGEMRRSIWVIFYFFSFIGFLARLWSGDHILKRIDTVFVPDNVFVLVNCQWMHQWHRGFSPLTCVALYKHFLLRLASEGNTNECVSTESALKLVNRFAICGVFLKTGCRCWQALDEDCRSRAVSTVEPNSQTSCTV